MEAFMTVVYIVLGVLVGILVAVIFPWALLRKLDSEDDGTEKKDER